MNLDAKKIELIQKLLLVEEEAVIYNVSKILDENIIAISSSGEPLNKLDYNKRIKIAEAQIKNGEYISQEALEQEVKNW